jgi:hypothetical protein
MGDRFDDEVWSVADVGERYPTRPGHALQRTGYIIHAPCGRVAELASLDLCPHCGS